jgi:hypothetical protein
LYGVIGWLASLVGVSHFAAYMIANGLGAALYLTLTWRLLRAIVPTVASRAFLLFACSGGLGGALYLMTGAAGLHRHPDFETYFFRFAAYDLMEGPHLNPITYYGRLYYTLSLSGLTLGFLGVLRALQTGKLRNVVLLAPVLLASSFLNARFGWFFIAIIAMYLLRNRDRGAATRFNAFGWFALPVSVGAVMSFQFMQQNLAVVANHLEFGNMAMWLSPFLVVVWLHTLIFIRPLMAAVRGSRGLTGVLLRFGLFYLWAYVLLQAAYQVYFGTWQVGRDGPVAAAISDVAVYLAVLGLFTHAVQQRWRAFRGKHPDERPLAPAAEALRKHDWLLIWLLGFIAISLSGFGQGWFLRFGPQRLEVLIWLPVCLVTALTLHHLPSTPRRMLTACLVLYGVVSIAVSTLFFQGPGGRAQAEGPFTKYHPEIMHAHDATVIDAIGEGTVMALPPASDAVVRRAGNNVVFGVGSFNLSGKYFGDARRVAQEFFDGATTTNRRRAIVDDLCVRYVYVPETWPVSEVVRAELDGTTWLRARARAGDAVIYQVMPRIDWEWEPYLASLSG